MTIPHTITKESINVTHKGAIQTIPKSAPNFVPLREALEAKDWARVPKLLTIDSTLEDWSKGKFKLSGGQIKFKGKDLPKELNDRIVGMVRSGDNPKAFFNFWERLERNPDQRSIDSLWPFLNRKGIPLTPDGCFLAYKGVKRDFKDAYSGKVDNSPGQLNKMPRDKVSSDPNSTCSYGFHVGSLGYASSHSQRVVVCKVDPENVVAVPRDHGGAKMRVCEYLVVGNHGSQLPDHLLDETAEGDSTSITVTEGPTSGAPVAVSSVIAKKGRGRRQWGKYDKMDIGQLMNVGVHELRAYAGHGLNIIGASRIPGGKFNLIQAIIQVRYDMELP